MAYAVGRAAAAKTRASSKLSMTAILRPLMSGLGLMMPVRIRLTKTTTKSCGQFRKYYDCT